MTAHPDADPTGRSADLLTSTAGSTLDRLAASPAWPPPGGERSVRPTSPSSWTTPSISRSASRRTAGIDIVTDGEMRRAGFFTAAFYGHLTGLRPLPPGRLVGATGHDQQHRFEVVEPIAAPNGLGVVAEYPYARARTARPLKVTIPGPFTLSGRLTSGRPGLPRPAGSCPEAFVPDPQLRVARAGRRRRRIRPDRRAVAGDPSRGACRLRRPLQCRASTVSAACRGGPLLFRQLHGPAAGQANLSAGARVDLAFRAHELVLEYANREMAELELLAEIAPHRDLAAGVVDVKNYYVETAEDVAERIDKVLARESRRSG